LVALVVKYGLVHTLPDDVVVDVDVGDVDELGLGDDEVVLVVGDVVLVVGVGVDEVGLVVVVGVGPLDVVKARSAPYDVPFAFFATSR
jgi:hypothetical protein